MSARFALLDRVALGLALAIFVAIGLAWGWDRVRGHETPRFSPAAFVALAPRAAASAGRPLGLVAVNPVCPHCRLRYRQLAAALAARADAPALGVLVVDTPRRPDTLSLGAAAPGGVWWDSAQVWRARWRRGLYGELLVFDPHGTLVAAHGPGWNPAAPAKD